ncbi:DUF7551 domain-containing protein [Halococcus thailandensis]|uniref:Uncharacterized protein n=1 Tax=Halococcus thailandensis JCM 13552 TaxID=1227457 RepID=M0NDY2_9EURY|nr:hypothetical protein [Halococcus thailandensis]EMA55773.1 hypothetical protein C451_04818 [Halococcus thailandensis JCM 13552]
MIGTTLGDIRDHIEALANEEGDYSLICGRYGERPIPAAGLRFESRPTARAAAQATEQYRAALRRYDPRLPQYDVIAQQAKQPHGVTELDQHSSDTNVDHQSLPDLDPATERQHPEQRELVEFCHRVAATVFEALSKQEYEALETVVMDSYFDLAETVTDPNDLCLCLLESMATELATRLDPAEQANVLSCASTLLTPLASVEKPVSTTFTRLQQLGFVGAYTQEPWSLGLDDGTRSVVIHLSEYALSPQCGRLPVLPIVLDLYRRDPDWLPSVVRVVDGGDGWRVTLVLAREADPEGLTSVPIQPEKAYP